jgi:predicted branched-subunit amino acid permease
VVWQTASLLGIFLASSLPREEGLRVLPALAILALLLPMIRSRPALACVLVSAIASLVFKGLPLNLGLFLATLAGVLTAVLLKRKAEQHG